MSEIEKLISTIARMNEETVYDEDGNPGTNRYQLEEMGMQAAAAVIELIRERMPPANTVGELRYMATVNEILDNIK